MKIKLLGILFLSGIGFAMKAQVAAWEYPSGKLSEERIATILLDMENKGADKHTVSNAGERLHLQLRRQEQGVIQNNNTTAQKTVSPPPQIMSGCNNSGFEDGTTSGWTLTQGASGDWSNAFNLPCPSCFTGSSGGVYEVLSTTGSSTVNTSTGNTCDQNTSNVCYGSSCIDPDSSGVDYFGGFPVVAPNDGNYSLLLNNSNSGFLMQRASQTFVVDNSNQYYSYQYAVVLQDQNHPVNEAPYLQITLFDLTTNSNIPNASIYECASQNLTGWQISPKDNYTYYKPWQTVNVDLSSLMNHTLSITFDVSDCNQGGHFGYAYIDANCGSSPGQITASHSALCYQGDMATLYGPAGYATYNWSGPITGNAQNLFTNYTGTYTLTASSASSTVTLNYTLNGPFNGLSAMATGTVICQGQPDTLIASGATTYTWSSNAGSATNDTAYVSPNVNTTYTVIGTNNTGCYDTAYVSITTTSLSLSTTASHTAICNGQSDSVFVSGAVTYTWSSNAGSVTNDTVAVTPHANTTYTVTGTDNNGCVAMDTMRIVVNPLPNVSITSSSNGVCAGNIDTLDAHGAGAYTWSTNETGFEITPIVNNSAYYSVWGTDANGCSSKDSVLVNAYNTPVATIAYALCTCMNNNTAFFDSTHTVSGDPDVSWYWTFTGYPTLITSTQQSPTINMANGTDTACLTITTQHGCTDDTCIVISGYTLSMSKLNNQKNISIYPNPASNLVNISSAKALETISVYNAVGQLVLQTQSKESNAQLDISKLQAGVYSVLIQGTYYKMVKE